jgi:hypothetical protein
MTFTKTFCLSMFVLLTLSACDRGAPPKPVGSATNKHVEETANALTGSMKAPMEKAQQADGVLQGAAEDRARQADQTRP